MDRLLTAKTREGDQSDPAPFHRMWPGTQDKRARVLRLCPEARATRNAV